VDKPRKRLAGFPSGNAALADEAKGEVGSLNARA